MRQELIDKVVSEFKTVFPDVEVPTISWNPRMRSVAGKVRVDLKMRKAIWIQLNPHLLQNDSDLERTLMHELCHVADCVLYGQRGHGRTWKHCMRLVGRQPERCHQYDTSHVKRRHKRVATMQCNCRTLDITANHLKKVQLGYRYRCLSCKEHLKLIQEKNVA